MRHGLLPLVLVPLGILAFPAVPVAPYGLIADVPVNVGEEIVALDTLATTPDTLKARANGKPCGGKHGGGGGGNRPNWGSAGQGYVGGPQGEQPVGKPAATVTRPDAQTLNPPVVATTTEVEPVQTQREPRPESEPVPQPMTQQTQPEPSPSPASAPQPAAPSDPQLMSAPSSDGQGMDQASWIAAHTAARARFGQSPVGWSTGAEAQARANVDAHKGSCDMQHTKNGKFGENLMAGTGGSGVAIANDVVGGWMDEAKDFKYTDPNGDHEGKVVGHFTVIVWKSVANIGCAVGKCGTSGTYIACCYDPPPNFVGQYGDMVPRPV